jgi:hypothetical protein
MTSKTLELAISRLAMLPEAAQEEIGRELMEHVDKRQRLLEDIDTGIRSLEAGLGRELDIEDVIKRARERHGRG